MERAGSDVWSTRTSTRVEWPTIAVAGSIAGGFAAMVAVHERLPIGVTIAVFGVLSAWYGSLRHEVVHGHPTPWPRVNMMIIAAPLSLTEPFWHYRVDHLRHHGSDDLTSPQWDPESQYLSAAAWDRTGPFVRGARVVNTTLAGRMIIGPWFAAATVVRDLARDWSMRRRRASIVRFLVADVAVIAGAHLAGFSVWQFILGVAYLGTSLTLVRSYTEHRAVPDGSRTAVVGGRGFWAVLFLNNNLHVTHHRQPGLAWYELPAAHAAGDADRVAAEGAGLYRGYGEVFRRFLFRPVGPVVDPLDRIPVTNLSGFGLSEPSEV